MKTDDLRTEAAITAIGSAARMLVPTAITPATNVQADPVAALTPDSTIDEVRVALRELQRACVSMDAGDRATERERAIAALGTVKAVSAPAKFVDSFIAEPAQLTTGTQGLPFPSVEPASESQVTGELLTAIAAVIAAFVILPVGAADVIATWVLHSWAFDAANYSARLWFTSPTRQCGKTRALELLETLCRKALMAAHASTAAMFRAIDAWRPTILLDETDTYFRDNEDMRGVLDAGFQRVGGSVLRCDGDENMPRRFVCFAPIVIAGIGRLWPTVADRAIRIPMQRKPPKVIVPDMDDAARDKLRTLASRCARWAADLNADALRNAKPAMPTGLSDRQRDVCRPLLAIADDAGGEWPERARRAIVMLCTAIDPDADETNERLLRAVWEQFESSEDAFLTLAELCSSLNADETAGWSEANGGKPVTSAWVSKRLRAFGLEAKQDRSDEHRNRGYRRFNLEPVAVRYLGLVSATQGVTPPAVTPSGPPVTPAVTPPNNANPLQNEPLSRCHASDAGGAPKGQSTSPEDTLRRAIMAAVRMR